MQGVLEPDVGHDLTSSGAQRHDGGTKATAWRFAHRSTSDSSSCVFQNGMSRMQRGWLVQIAEGPRHARRLGQRYSGKSLPTQVRIVATSMPSLSSV